MDGIVWESGSHNSATSLLNIIRLVFLFCGPAENELWKYWTRAFIVFIVVRCIVCGNTVCTAFSIYLHGPIEYLNRRFFPSYFTTEVKLDKLCQEREPYQIELNWQIEIGVLYLGRLGLKKKGKVTVQELSDVQT